jgi:hypothetical protein
MDRFSGNRSVFPGGVSEVPAGYAADLLKRWFEEHPLDGEYKWQVSAGQMALTGRWSTTVNVQPSPWAEDGPYRPELIDDVIGWAVRAQPPEPPDPANYLARPNAA